MRVLRILPVLLALAVGASAWSQATPKDAASLLSAARAEAKSQKKHVFVIFHASW